MESDQMLTMIFDASSTDRRWGRVQLFSNLEIGTFAQLGLANNKRLTTAERTLYNAVDHWWAHRVSDHAVNLPLGEAFSVSWSDTLYPSQLIDPY